MRKSILGGFSEVQPNPFSQAQSLNSQLIQLRACAVPVKLAGQSVTKTDVTSVLVRKSVIVVRMR